MKIPTFPLSSWADAAPRLVAVAAGRVPADLVVRQGQWVNVHTREVLPGHDIAIAEGRFAAIAPRPAGTHLPGNSPGTSHRVAVAQPRQSV